MQPITLATLVALADHTGKAVVLLGKGACIKEQDKNLLDQLLAAAGKCENKVITSLVEEIICNQNNDKKKIFDF